MNIHMYIESITLVIIKILYNILYLPIAFTRIIIKSFSNKEYLKRLNERVAIYYKNNNKVDIWFHAVSVGEFIAVKPLITEVLKHHPDYKLLITTTTPTGSKLVQDFIADKTNNNIDNKYSLEHVYYPYDLKSICQRFINCFKPKLAVFMETEIWPNMYACLETNNIKLKIINARLSQKSYDGYAKYEVIKSYINNTINKVDLIAAQTGEDLKRFVELGCSKEKIKVLGNIKYNIKLPSDLDGQSKYYKNLILKNTHNKENKFILIAASTHKGEEEIIARLYKQLAEKYNILLVLVPRHPERTGVIYNTISKIVGNNIDIVKYSELEQNKNIDILLVDTIGKLLYFYNIADIAYIGGSMVPVGGHNPIEPAILKIPTIIGKYYHNFQEIVDNMLDQNGLILVNNQHELKLKIEELLNKKDLRETIAQSSYNYLNQQGNIINKYLDEILA